MFVCVRRMDVCWIVRAVNSSSMIHIQPHDMDLEPDRQGECVYDWLSVEDPGKPTMFVICIYFGITVKQ